MTRLFQLHADIDVRVASIRERRPDWLCGKGCDRCCRQLAEVPRLTDAEWRFLRAGLEKLSAAVLREIHHKVASLASPSVRPVVCPLLDESTGACPVYAQRPVACRTYGFYVQRDKGLYCPDIETRVAEGDWADVVWGNHDAIDGQLAGLGETRSLTECFKQWARSVNGETANP